MLIIKVSQETAERAKKAIMTHCNNCRECYEGCDYYHIIKSSQYPAILEELNAVAVREPSVFGEEFAVMAELLGFEQEGAVEFVELAAGEQPLDMDLWFEGLFSTCAQMHGSTN